MEIFRIMRTDQFKECVVQDHTSQLLSPPVVPDVPRKSPRVTSAESGGADERSYQRLAERIAGLIAQGEFKVGERLPSERSLAERFSISRTSVREAVIALEVQGLVEVRGGSGIYVCDASKAQAVGYVPGDGAGPFELLRARWVVESEIAAFAAENRTDTDIDKIYAQLVAMGRNLDDKLANAADDRLFHIRIAQATGNGVLARVVTTLWDQLRGVIWDKIEEHFHTVALREASLADHQQIFDALMARDSAAARTAMRRHLERVMQEFAKGWR